MPRNALQSSSTAPKICSDLGPIKALGGTVMAAPNGGAWVTMERLAVDRKGAMLADLPSRLLVSNECQAWHFEPQLFYEWFVRHEINGTCYALYVCRPEFYNALFQTLKGRKIPVM